MTTPADVYYAEHPLTPTWWLVLSALRPSDQISKSLSVLGARGNEQSLRYCWPRRPVSRTCDKDWNDRPRLVVISRVPSLVTRLHSSHLSSNSVVTIKCHQTHDTSGRTPLFLATSGLGDRYVFKHGTVNQGIRVVSMPMRNPRNHPRWTPIRQVPIRWYRRNHPRR